LLAALEAVVVATTDDELQSEVGQRSQHCEVRTRDRRAGPFIDLDREMVTTCLVRGVPSS
jgi:hypothetical protein